MNLNLRIKLATCFKCCYCQNMAMLLCQVVTLLSHYWYVHGHIVNMTSSHNYYCHIAVTLLSRCWNFPYHCCHTMTQLAYITWWLLTHDIVTLSHCCHITDWTDTLSQHTDRPYICVTLLSLCCHCYIILFHNVTHWLIVVTMWPCWYIVHTMLTHRCHIVVRLVWHFVSFLSLCRLSLHSIHTVALLTDCRDIVT